MFDTQGLETANTLRKSFNAAAADEEYSSVYEMMVIFKGRISVKHHVASEPTKWGFKIWARIRLPGHAEGSEPDQYSGANRNIPTQGLGRDVVVKLTHGLKTQTLTCTYFNNLFLSFLWWKH
ncbi:hypothetical protein QYM36_010712 [Artemia franciscana]|uniref:PiggyBac transposable element-derived protein domain-containing protein n=1 Tax=Artemia franciscana TaxID=6661 RepID=A0AA88I6L0_ARTSF|nr:hypothetical protein QYM36_010712 [Artemia franciscana]